MVHPATYPIEVFTGGVKWSDREVDHSSLSSVMIKNAWSYVFLFPVYCTTVSTHERSQEAKGADLYTITYANKEKGRGNRWIFNIGLLILRKM
jgi:hypothetical protein